jgi:hypothetical protein
MGFCLVVRLLMVSGSLNMTDIVIDQDPAWPPAKPDLSVMELAAFAAISSCISSPV